MAENVSGIGTPVSALHIADQARQTALEQQDAEQQCQRDERFADLEAARITAAWETQIRRHLMQLDLIFRAPRLGKNGERNRVLTDLRAAVDAAMKALWP